MKLNGKFPTQWTCRLRKNAKEFIHASENLFLKRELSRCTRPVDSTGGRVTLKPQNRDDVTPMAFMGVDYQHS